MMQFRTRIWLPAALAIAAGAMVMTGASGDKGGAPALAAPAPQQPGTCNPVEVQTHLAAISDALIAARKAVQISDKQKALAALDEATMHLEVARRACSVPVGAPATGVNARCPITHQ